MRRGFTLLELLIVLIVGMILAGTVIPAAHTMDDQILTGDARVLQSDLEFVQARSIATGLVHRIVFDVANEWYQVESPPGVTIEEPLSRRPWRRQLGEGTAGTDLVSVDFAGTRAVTYNAAGVPDHGGSVDFARGTFQARVVLSAVTGEVTVTTP